MVLPASGVAGPPSAEFMGVVSLARKRLDSGSRRLEVWAGFSGSWRLTSITSERGRSWLTLIPRF